MSNSIMILYNANYLVENYAPARVIHLFCYYMIFAMKGIQTDNNQIIKTHYRQIFWMQPNHFVQVRIIRYSNSIQGHLISLHWRNPRSHVQCLIVYFYWTFNCIFCIHRILEYFICCNIPLRLLSLEKWTNETNQIFFSLNIAD